MAGYSRPHYANGVLDDIFAHGILLEDVRLGNIKQRFLFLSLDVLKVPRMVGEYIKDEIKDRVDFALGHGHILIHATHTHSAPDLTGEFFWPGGAQNVVKGIMFGANRCDRYVVWITERIVRLVRRMAKNLEQAEMGWESEKVQEDLIINRRHPGRRSKGTLGVLAFRRPVDKSLIGLLVTYQCHPTTLSWLNDKISADFPGRVVAQIEEKTEGKVKAAYFNGAAGDLNPITTCGPYYEAYEKYPSLRNNIYGQKGTYEHTKKMGNLLGDKALALGETIKEADFFPRFEFTSHLKTFWVPNEDHVYMSKTFLANKFVYLLKKYLVLPVAMCRDEEDEPNFPGLAIKKRGNKTNAYSLNHYIEFRAYSDEDGREKSLSIFGVPGELFEDIGKRFLEVSPAGEENTFIFQNANDWIAYLFPLTEYVSQGGYEPMASYGPLCGDYVEREMYLLLKKIQMEAEYSHF